MRILVVADGGFRRVGSFAISSTLRTLQQRLVNRNVLVDDGVQLMVIPHVLVTGLT
jgi:hypothetical protein